MITNKEYSKSQLLLLQFIWNVFSLTRFVAFLYSHFNCKKTPEERKCALKARKTKDNTLKNTLFSSFFLFLSLSLFFSQDFFFFLYQYKRVATTNAHHSNLFFLTLTTLFLILSPAKRTHLTQPNNIWIWFYWLTYTEKKQYG